MSLDLYSYVWVRVSTQVVEGLTVCGVPSFDRNLSRHQVQNSWYYSYIELREFNQEQHGQNEKTAFRYIQSSYLIHFN